MEVSGTTSVRYGGRTSCPPRQRISVPPSTLSQTLALRKILSWEKCAGVVLCLWRDWCHRCQRRVCERRATWFADSFWHGGDVQHQSASLAPLAECRASLPAAH